MKRPFRRFRQKSNRAVVKWASQSFAGGSTFRMFASEHSEMIRQFLRDRVGDCEVLGRARTADEYMHQICTLVDQFQRSEIKMNALAKKPRMPSFGQAAKVINLYIKQYLLRPGFMGRREATRASSLYRWAHVPLDRIVLENVWKDFAPELKLVGFSRKPEMRILTECQYRTIQGAIAKAAKKEGLPPLAYDFCWADR